MTGFGEASRRSDGVAVAVEVRTINSRYIKLAVRCSEGYSSLEPQIENFVRQKIKRGTIQVTVRVDRTKASDDYRINAAVLEGYRQQLSNLQAQWSGHAPAGTDGIPLEKLLLLPGVVDEDPLGGAAAEEDWPMIASTLDQAVLNLASMREEEGRTMADDLLANLRSIAAELSRVEARAPQVVDGYRGRLEERLKKLLAEHQVTLDPGDLIREVSIFAERSDISEEIVRLKSHLEQFEASMQLAESSGRKLEFLTQEMFREANTIGSKANDVQISRHVIEIKGAIEKIKEMIQNIE